jgi:hypothetical protein
MTATSRAGRCPACGYLTDAVAGLNTPGAPDIGDATLCLNCGHVMVFTAYGQRSATPEELEEVLAEPAVKEAIRHIRERGFIPGYRR